MAALDAAAGRRWVHEPVAGDGVGPRYASQRRWLAASARLVGLTPELAPGVVERIVGELGVVASEHAVERRRYAASSSLAEQGRGVVRVLDAIGLESGLASRVLAAGHLAGLWGRPWLCDPHTGRRFGPRSSAGRWRRGPPSVRS